MFQHGACFPSGLGLQHRNTNGVCVAQTRSRPQGATHHDHRHSHQQDRRRRVASAYPGRVGRLSLLLGIGAFRSWEPAWGRGSIVNVLRAHGHEVVASDLVNHSVPVTPSGYYGLVTPPGYYGVDFLLEWKAPDGCECIISNPPFKLAEEFAAHALMLCPRVVMLLRLAFLESERRREILEGRGLARVHVFRRRLRMMQTLRVVRPPRREGDLVRR